MHLNRLVIVAAFALGACTTEKIQFVTRPFVQGKDTANGFLGYFTIGDKQTNCGNCHVGTQARLAVAEALGAHAPWRQPPGELAQAAE